MPRYCAYRYYLGSTVYEVDADNPQQAYARIEHAVQTGFCDPGGVRMKHEAMLPALNEITTHVFELTTAYEGAECQMADDPCLIMHKARDEKLSQLINTSYDEEPELQQP